jgi:hypothetical protein
MGHTLSYALMRAVRIGHEQTTTQRGRAGGHKVARRPGAITVPLGVTQFQPAQSPGTKRPLPTNLTRALCFWVAPRTSDNRKARIPWGRIDPHNLLHPFVSPTPLSDSL